MAHTQKFTKKNIELILRFVPEGSDQRRLKLLPKILRDWGSHDLPQHLSVESNTERKDRIKRLNADDACVKKLVEALDEVDRHDDQSLIVYEIMKADGRRSYLPERIRIETIFEEMKEFLAKLSTASVAGGKVWKQDRGHLISTFIGLLIVKLCGPAP